MGFHIYLKYSSINKKIRLRASKHKNHKQLNFNAIHFKPKINNFKNALNKHLSKFWTNFCLWFIVKKQNNKN
jgi:hypothetical protein